MFDSDTLEQLEALQTYTDKAEMEKKRSYWDTADIIGMDEEEAKMLYVYYFAKDSSYVPSGTKFVDFVDFMKKDVARNPMFSSYIDDDALEQMKMLEAYTDRSALREQLSYKSMAKKLGMSEDEAKMIYIYYLMEDDDYTPNKMTLRNFIAFMKDDVAVNPVFSSYIDEDALEQIDMLAALTDYKTLNSQLPLSTLAQMLGIEKEAVDMIYLLYQIDNTNTAVEEMQKPLSLSSLADTLGIDQKTAEMLYIRHQMNNPDYLTGEMTLSNFVTFVRNNVAGNSSRSSYVDDDTLSQIIKAYDFADRQRASAQRTSAELAALLGVGETVIQKVFELSGNTSDTMSITETISFILSNDEVKSMVGASSVARLKNIQTVIQVAAEGKTLSYEKIASTLGLDENEVRTLFIISDSMTGKLSIMDACTLIISDAEIQSQIDEKEYLQLTMLLANVFPSSINGEAAMSLEDLVSFILSKNEIRAMLDRESLSQLQMLDEIISLAKADRKLSYQRIADVLGMDEDSIRAIFILREGDDGTMSIKETVSFILSNREIKSTLDSDALDQLEILDTIIEYVLDDTSLTYEDIAEFADMNIDDAKMLLTYRDAQNDKFENSHYLSVQQVINFLIDNKRDFSSTMGDSWDDIKTAQKLINAAVEGTLHSPSDLARLLGMSKSQIEDLYLLYRSEYGDTSAWKLSPQEFVTFTVNKVLPNEAFSSYFDEETTAQLKSGKKLC